MKKKEFNLEEQEEENQRLIKRMEKEEFNLSDKIEVQILAAKYVDGEPGFFRDDYIHKNYVKEFIKKLKDNLKPDRDYKTIAYRIIVEKIDKLAGDKLI